MNSLSPLTQKLVQVLLGKDCGLDALGVADTLWLMTQMGTVEAVATESTVAIESMENLAIQNIAEIEIDDDLDDRSMQNSGSQTSAPEVNRKSADVVLPSDEKSGVGSSEESVKTMPISAPKAPSLRNGLDLARSLRPLKRRVASATKQVLDEEATAIRIAEGRSARTPGWIPAMVPEMEYWLEVAIVVEESRSTFIWRDLIDEFRVLLERQGAFRDVRTWSLERVSEDWRLRSWDSNSGQLYRPEILREPRGRRLILVVSDGVSAAWREGLIQPLLKKWGKELPVTWVQLMPERMWSRTAVAQGYRSQLCSREPGMASGALEVSEMPLWLEEEEERLIVGRSLKLPVVTLEPGVLGNWARMMTGLGVVNGVLFDDPLEVRQVKAGAGTDVAGMMQDFWLTASPLAQELARLMSAAPVSLPVVHLIQQVMLQESWQVHVAEVFLSGLVERSESGEYEFAIGVREALGRAIPVGQSWAVLEAISGYFAARAGLAVRGFAALLMLREEGDGAVPEVLRPFAMLAPEVLRRMGGDYAVLADRITRPIIAPTVEPEPLVEEPIVKSKSPDEDDSVVFPPLQTFTFETVELEETKTEALQIFKFETAKLTVESKGWLRQSNIVIKKQRGQCFGYVERIGQAIDLKMVKIRGGRFVMGAPKNEPESMSDERPQHSVTVPEFFIGQYSVTQAQWKVVAGMAPIEIELDSDPSGFKGDDRPVERVSWDEAIEFCARLSEHTGRAYRLPSEAEWEYACRGGTTTAFSFGETIDAEIANYRAQDWKPSDTTYSGKYGKGQLGEYRETTTPVGTFPANAYGLYDMHGNVWEWCEDHWHGDYEGAPEDGNAWLENDSKPDPARVLRGGSWDDDPRRCRSAYRNFYAAGARNDSLGFRVVSCVPRTLP